MAIFHLNVKPISRGKGRSAMGASAYHSASVLKDLRLNLQHDYSKKQGVVKSDCFYFHDNKKITLEREQLWNIAELSESASNARTAREIVVNIPHELNEQQRQNLITEFTENLSKSLGVAIDYSIHLPSKDGDDRNHHAHIMLTTRNVVHRDNGFSLGEKTDIELSNKKLKSMGRLSTQDQIVNLRQDWELLANEHLFQAGRIATIDHRSHKDRGLDILPTVKLGPVATAIERNRSKNLTATTSKMGDFNRDIVTYNTKFIKYRDLEKIKAYTPKLAPPTPFEPPRPMPVAEKPKAKPPEPKPPMPAVQVAAPRPAPEPMPLTIEPVVVQTVAAPIPAVKVKSEPPVIGPVVQPTPTPKPQPLAEKPESSPVEPAAPRYTLEQLKVDPLLRTPQDLFRFKVNLVSDRSYFAAEGENFLIPVEDLSAQIERNGSMFMHKERKKDYFIMDFYWSDDGRQPSLCPLKSARPVYEFVRGWLTYPNVKIINDYKNATTREFLKKYHGKITNNNRDPLDVALIAQEYGEYHSLEPEPSKQTPPMVKVEKAEPVAEPKADRAEPEPKPRAENERLEVEKASKPQPSRPRMR